MKYGANYWTNLIPRLQAMDQYEPTVKALLGWLLEDQLDALQHLLKDAGSPIEQLMALALDNWMCETKLNYHIEPQAPIEVNSKRYRVDLLVEIHQGDKCTEFAIECDGHNFHEKTKEQARRDKERERALQARGLTVIRFTGSEIWRNPFRCAEDAVRIILGGVE